MLDFMDSRSSVLLFFLFFFFGIHTFLSLLLLIGAHL